MRRITFLVALSILLLIVASGPLAAQEAKLVEAAKKEGGKAVVYGSIENDTMDLIAAAFRKKTGLDVDYWRAASNKVTDRVAGESRAGKPLFDVVLTTESTMKLIQLDGFLGKYDSPAARAFPKEVIDPNLGPSYRSTSLALSITRDSSNHRRRQSPWRIS
ncbi:MAG TPA: hypothetical protein VGK77_18685 [Candidatus Binatia bacterium]